MSELSEGQFTEFQVFRKDVRHEVSYKNARCNSVGVELHALRTDVRALRTELHNAVQVIMGGLDRFYLLIQEDLRRIENKNSAST